MKAVMKERLSPSSPSKRMLLLLLLLITITVITASLPLASHDKRHYHPTKHTTLHRLHRPSPSPTTSITTKPTRPSPPSSPASTTITTARGGGGSKAPRKLAASSPLPSSPSPSSPPSVAYAVMAALLYNLSIAFTVPVFPKLINGLINKGDTRVTPESASFYGMVTGTDQLMTFLLVNGACSLSDRYGRKGFLALSNLGLGTGQVIAYLAKNPYLLIVGAFIDGCTSYSYPLNQAYIADVVTDPTRLTEAYGLFQGVATGMAFMLGIPISGILASKRGLHLPLLVAASICAVNILFITFAMPESLPPSRRTKQPTKTAGLKDANALGALKMVCRNPFMALIAATYFLLHLSLNGLQVNFINYCQAKFSWGIAQSSSALCLMFAFVAFLPKIILPLLGVRRSVSLCSLVYAAAFFLLGATKSGGMVYPALILLATGATALPATLALLTNQVSEKGAANGAADTCRTLSSMIGFPLGAQIFAYGLNRQIPGLVFYAGSVVILLAYIALQSAITYHSHHDKSA